MSTLLCAAQDESPAELIAVAKTQYQTRRYADALATYEKARALAESTGDAIQAAHAKIGIASVKRLRNDLEAARTLGEEAVATFAAAHDRAGEANALFQLANTHILLGNLTESLDGLRRALQLTDDDRLRADYLQHAGTVEWLLGRLRDSMNTSMEAVHLAEASKDRTVLAAAFTNIGGIHYAQGNFELALHYWEQTLAIAREQRSNVSISQNLNNLAEAYRRLGRYEQALAMFRENLALTERLNYTRGIVASKTNVARVLLDVGRPAEAMQMCRELLTLLEQVDVPNMKPHALGCMADAYEAAGDDQHALDYAALARAAGTDDWENAYDNAARQGHLYRELGRDSEACDLLAEAIGSLEAVREHSAGEERLFFDRRANAYADMAGILIAEKRPADALEFAERFRSRVLVDILRSGSAGKRQLTTQEQKREKELTAALAKLNREAARKSTPDLQERIIAARREYEGHQHELASAYPRLRLQRGDVAPARLSEVAPLLTANTALVEYLVSDHRTYVFVVADGKVGARVIELPRDEITRRAQSFRDAIAAHRPDFRTSARSLYQTLLAPIASLLAKRTSWIVVPDGPLWDLPFHALLDSRGTYVAERAAIVYAPSITAWREMSRPREKSSKRRELFALGNPTVAATLPTEHTRSGSAALPDAETEVKNVARLYGPRSTVYLRDQATEERFKSEAPGYRVLHLATHGVVNDVTPMYSYVALAAPKKGAIEDGFLEAGELMDMDLGADLVVLSACETARGKHASGEGMIGLSWALFAARCRTQVLSQWKVDSAATSSLMRGFHARLKTGKTTASAALQQSIVAMLHTKEYRHPFYWAGFIVLGDGD
jgi:CHAT domain-containing protein